MGLIPFLLFIAAVSARETIVRKEYGVVFTPLETLNTATSSWHHTFAYDLNAKNVPTRRLDICDDMPRELNPGFTVNYLSVLCAHYTKAGKLIGDIGRYQRSLDQLLPARPAFRTKRGQIDAIGKASKWLFGTSTEEDTKILQRQIDWLRDRLDKGRASLQASIDETRSTMSQFSRRQDLLTQAVRLSEQRLLGLFHDLQELMENNNKHIHAIFSIDLYLDLLHDIKHELNNDVIGVQTLLDGYLPVTIVSPSTMEYVLHDLSVRLRGSVFRLALNDVAAYYKTKDVVYDRQSDFLYITIKIPLESVKTSYQVYRIDTVPLRSGNEQTQIKFQDPYLAVSDDSFFYFQMSEADYLACSGEIYRKCHRGFAIKENSNPSCIMALFENDHVKIKHLCDFKFLFNSDQITTQVVPLNDNSYLISTSDTEWIQTCPYGTPVHVNSCPLCVVTLPCSCSLKGRTFFIPPSLDHCDTNLTTTVTQVTHNFATLMKFYEDLLPALNLSERLLQLDSQIEYPSLDIKDTRFEEVLRTSDEIGISINASLEKFKSNDQVYADSGSYLYDKLGWYTNPIVTTGMPALSSFTFLMTICALGMSLRNFFFVAVLARRVDAGPWVGISTTPSAPQTVMNTCTSCSVAVYLLWSMILCLIVIILWLILRWIWCRKQTTVRSSPLHTSFSLIFVHRTEYTDLSIVLLPFALDSLELITDSIFVRPRVITSCLTCKLDFIWTSVQVKCRDVDGNLLFPETINVPLYLRRKISQIVQSADVIQLRVESDEKAIIVRTWVADQIHDYGI